MDERQARNVGVLAAMILPALMSAAPLSIANAQADESPGTACGRALSPPIYDKWLASGGQQGFLGCPAQKETAALPSPTGATAREVLFANGEILWHASGPHAGQTYFLAGCFFRLYFQYGDTGGWLGLPLSDPVNTPDGKKQAYEGGVIVYQRAIDQCDAQRGGPPAAAIAQGAAKAPLNLFVDPTTGAYYVTASTRGAAEAAQLHLQAVETEGFVYTEPGPGLKELKTYQNETTGDHMTVGTEEGEKTALAAGYVFDGSQGYVFADPRAGAVALTLWWNPQRKTSLLATTDREETDAKSSGYGFVRVEGYAATSP